MGGAALSNLAMRRGFIRAEDAKPKVPRKDGEPCEGGCGRLESSCWCGPGSVFCNETCRNKAKEARAALTAAKGGYRHRYRWWRRQLCVSRAHRGAGGIGCGAQGYARRAAEAACADGAAAAADVEQC